MTAGDFEYEAEKLFTGLENSEEVTELDRHKGVSGGHFIYYASITGLYKGKYFDIDAMKSKASEKVVISECVTEDSKELKSFLDSLTTLKFDIV